MSFGDATVDLHLDSTTAGRDLARFLANAARESAVVPMEVDASEVPGAIEAAVEAAEAQAIVTADASEVGSSIEAAVEGADTTAVVQTDASSVVSRIEAAMAGADKTAVVEADASNVGSAVQSAIDDVDPSIPVNVPPGSMRGFSDEVGGVFDEVRRDADRTSNSIFEAFRPTPRKIAALLGGLVIAAGVSYNSLVQRTTAAFETLLGSASAASAKVQEIVTFAQGSPFPRQVFLEATQTLIAFGLEADRVVPVLDAIQDAVAAAGGGADQIKEISSALAEVVSTGRFGADTLDQLGIRGVDAAKIIGEQMGLTAQEIREGLSERTIEAGAAFDALIVGMKENFGGAAANVKETWVGAVDRIKAAVRDLSSAIVEPFISTGGGGAAVVFANQLADALRRLEDGIVPVAQGFSEALVPILEALGTDLLPAVIDALIAMAPALGQTASLISSLAPVISILAKAIDLIPDPLLQIIGMFLVLRAAAQPVTEAMESVGAGIMRIGLGATAAAAPIAAMTIVVAALAAALAVWAMRQAETAQNAAEMAAQQAALGEAFESTKGTIAGVTEVLGDMVAEGEALQSMLGRLAFEADLATVFREAGISVRQFSEGLADTDQPMDKLIDKLGKGDRESKIMAVTLSQLSEDLEQEAKAALSAGVTTELWTEAQRKAAIEASRNADGTRNYIAALETLQAPALAAAEAAEAHTEEVVRQDEALTELLGTVPRVNDLMVLASSATDLATAGLIGLADELTRVGAGEEALAAVANQLGVDATRFAEFVELMGGHLDTLREDILEGLPQLPDIFGRALDENVSAETWAQDTLDAINFVTQVINDFAPNLENLNPWPRLREQAAREGPEVAARYAEIAKSGSTAILDETEAAIALHGQAVFGFAGNIEGQIPTFTSTNELMAFLGGEAFTANYNPDPASGMGAATEAVRGALTADAAAAAAEAGASAAGGFTENFTPDAGTGMTNLPPQITAANVGAAAQSAAFVATQAWNLNFTPDVSTAMGGLAMGLSGWGPVFNGTMSVLGSGAAGSFMGAFAPNPSAAMETLAGGISGWGPVINGILAVMGEQGALAFVAAFTPIGSTATTVFGETFKPNPWPALSGMIAQAQMATTTFVNQMQQMAGLSTQLFNATFQPDPVPALSRMLAAAQSFVGPLGQAGLMAGRFYTQALTGELTGGANAVSAIVASYAQRLAAGLNTILSAIGKPTINLADGGIELFARGGIEDHIAQIAPAGAMRVWAEPETGGEAYIPLAAAKRPRSRKIAEETVQRLGGNVQWFQRGGVTGDVVGMHPAFLARLAMWAASMDRTYVIGSGYRSMAEQAVLYSRWLRRVPGQAKAAAPGSSMHNFGLASDGPHWGGLGPGRFGMRYPMSFEPWHIEPNEARAWAGRGAWGGEGFFPDPLPLPPDIGHGYLGHTGHQAARYTYDNSLGWATGAFGDISTPALAAANGGITFFRRPFDTGGTLAPGWNMVANATGRDETVVPTDGGVTIILEDGAIRAELPEGISPLQGRVIGRQLGRGFTEALADRRVRTDARLGGGR